MNIQLNTLLQYKNDRLINRYKKDYPNATLSAEDALQEFLKFVWLCHQQHNDILQHPNDDHLKFTCAIHFEMLEIDNMWHTFLLFTKDYQAFCNNYLNGHFFHHEPANDAVMDGDKYQADLTNYLSYIYDKLGQETLLRWFG